MATPVLEMQNVEKNFGGVRAIDNFSVMLEPGKIHGLIGPNGAGKTTIFNNITGIYAPDSGKIIFNGTDITGSAPHRVAQLGIGRTWWALPIRPTSRPAPCPTATSASWRSPAPWRWTPSCCCWTSRPPV